MWLSPLLWQAETKNGTLKKKRRTGMAVANIQIRTRIRLRPGNSFRETVFRRRMNESNRRTGFTSYVSRFPVKKTNRTRLVLVRHR